MQNMDPHLEILLPGLLPFVLGGHRTEGGPRDRAQ